MLMETLPSPELPVPHCRMETLASRRLAVSRVILAMQQQGCEPLSLHEMAEIAMMSPFHFDRVFRQVTGVAPRQFSSAMRLATAKRLLLTTDLNVLDVSLEVGYESLGSFTTMFTRSVGISPMRLRRLADRGGAARLELAEPNRARARPYAAADVTGMVVGPPMPDTVIFIGLFPTAIPQNLPLACTIIKSSGPFRIRNVPEGRYYALALALNSENPLHIFMGDGAWRGESGRVIRVQGDILHDNVEVQLHAPRVTDPPLVIAVPYLLFRRASQEPAIA